MAETVDISIRARIADFEAEMRKIPGISEREIKAAKNAMQKAWKLPDPHKEMQGKLNDLKRGASAVFGGIVGDVEDVGGALAALGGPAGLAVAGIAGIGAAGVGAAAGIWKIVDAGDEAIARLDKLSGVAVIPPDVRERIDSANDSMEALAVVADMAKVALANELAPAAERMAEIMVELGLRAIDTFNAFLDGKSLLEEVGVWMGSTFVQLLAAPVSSLFQLLEILGAVGDALGYQNNALSRVGQAYDDWTDSLVRSAITSAESSEALALNTTRAEELISSYRRAEDAAKNNQGAHKANTDAAREHADAVAELVDNIDEFVGASAELGERIQQMTEQDLNAFYGPSVEMGERVLADTERYVEQIRGAWLGMAGDVIEAFDDLGKASEQRHRDELDAIRAERKAQEDSIDGLTKAERDALRSRADEQKAAILKAFVAQQAAAIASIGVNAAAAILNAMATLPAPAWPVAITGVGIMAGVQAGLVASEPPPKFHTGRAPQEQLAVLDSQEGVANRRAMNTPGFAQQLAAANRGEAASASSSTFIVLGDRVVEQVVARGARGRRARVEIRRAAGYGGGNGRGGYR